MNLSEYTTIMKDAVVTTLKGMGVTLRIFMKVQKKGPITIQYPEIKDRIPLGSRGLLFNDVEDCNVCRSCAAACPSNCIFIEGKKKSKDAPIEFTRSGAKKTILLNKYVIDTSLCCFCGLCVDACPTNCIYHTKDYEYSVVDRDKHIMDYLNYRR